MSLRITEHCRRIWARGVGLHMTASLGGHCSGSVLTHAKKGHIRHARQLSATLPAGRPTTPSLSRTRTKTAGGSAPAPAPPLGLPTQARTPAPVAAASARASWQAPGSWVRLLWTRAPGNPWPTQAAGRAQGSAWASRAARPAPAPAAAGVARQSGDGPRLQRSAHGPPESCTAAACGRQQPGLPTPQAYSGGSPACPAAALSTPPAGAEACAAQRAAPGLKSLHQTASVHCAGLAWRPATCATGKPPRKCPAAPPACRCLRHALRTLGMDTASWGCSAPSS
mmetsp:Transcript_105479/g.298081  ORF Transcript_105479/g.298081 Transcript_105479/m.298081 type:complete len:282 (+) Transcript_105479:455-1300(+)